MTEPASISKSAPVAPSTATTAVTAKGRPAGLDRLFSTVVEGGYCIGCGACTTVPGSPIVIQLDEYGCFRATLGDSTRLEGLESTTANVSAVCPFSEDALDEDQLAERLFPDAPSHDPHLGRYASTYAGYVSEPGFRSKGGSGGIGKWLLVQLLRKGMVDHVVQVSPASGGDAPLFTFAIFSDPDEVLQGASSAYYPVEMSGVLSQVRTMEGRFAFIGIPCFIKAIRLLALGDDEIRGKIKYCIGLVCGHLKSTRYADMIAWQKGIQPGDLQSINFRRKIAGRRANEKGFEITGMRDGRSVSELDVVQNFFGAGYNDGLFKYKACEYCDDVVAETADISVGDAWLPEYIEDWRGTSVVVVRNPEMQALVDEARADGLLSLEELRPDRVTKSQAGGFRDRREGLAYRLHLADRSGAWRPPKRIDADKRHISRRRRTIYRMRIRITRDSHRLFRDALQKQDFNLFHEGVVPVLEAYRKAYETLRKDYRVSLPIRLRVFAGRLLRQGGLSGLTQRVKRMLGRSPLC